MMLQGILWDNDGVLVDTEQLFFLANRDILREYGLDLTEEQFFQWYLLDNCGSWHLFSGQGMAEDQLSAIREKRNALYMDNLRQAPHLAIDGMQDLLQRLHGRLPMGVVTSAYREHFEAIHSRMSMRGYFDFVLSNEEYQHSKPSPEPYLLGLNRLGIAAQECLVVEDSPRGLQAARAAGIRCIILRNHMIKGYAFPGAYQVVDSVAELSEVLSACLAS